MTSKRSFSSLLISIIVPLLLLVFPARIGTAAKRANARAVDEVKQRSAASYGRLPLSFDVNQGQTDPRVKFLSRGSGYTLFLTGDEAVLTLRKPSVAGSRQSPVVSGQLSGITKTGHRTSDNGARTTNAVLRTRLVGANVKAAVTGAEELPGKSNYFIGNDPQKWRTNVPNYAKVRYQGVYPGVDLVYYGNQGGRLEYDFVVAPGADPRAIRFALETGNWKLETGNSKPAAFQSAIGNRQSTIRLDANGDVVVKTDGGEVRFQKPVVYQPMTDDPKPQIQNRKLLDGRYVLLAGNRVGFEIPNYDNTKPLVIDPVLSYSTYLGGSGVEGGSSSVSIAVDGSGNAYVASGTSSLNFPATTGAFQTTNKGATVCNQSYPCGDAMVAKINPTGSQLVYSTYLGGTGDDYADGLAVDSAGNAYVTGVTSSTDFPTTPEALQTGLGGGYDIFVTKLNATGSALVYSTYLGGSEDETVEALALDSSGDAYVAGGSSSTNFPTTSGAYDTTFSSEKATALGCGSSGAPEPCPYAIVTELNPAGTGLIYSTFLGGSGNDSAGGLAVDSSGAAYVTGWTSSIDFPTTAGAFQNSLKAVLCGPGWQCPNAFFTKLNPQGKGLADLAYSTYLGGTGNEYPFSAAVDPSGNAYVVGLTSSNDFPTTPGAFQTTHLGPSITPGCYVWSGCAHAFVSKINPADFGPASLVYSTYLSGSGDDWGAGIAVDSSGNAYVTGWTNSTDFPVLDALQPANAGGYDAYITELNAAGSGLISSTYLGGSGNDLGDSIGVDSSGNVYVGGWTESANFPTTPGSVQPLFGGARDLFMAKILTSLGVSAGTLTFPLTGVGSTTPSQTLTLTNNGTEPMPVNITTSPGFSETNNCPPILAVGASCTIWITSTPTGGGTQAGQLIISGPPGGPAVVPLTVQGILPGNIATLAGGGANSAVATRAVIVEPSCVAVDKFGNTFVASRVMNQVFKADSAGNFTVVAGNGTGGFGGDGGPATSASLSYPLGVAVDSAGNLFIADYDNYRIRRVDAATGVITTVAGGGSPPSGIGDGGLATSASLNGPTGVAVDSSGNLFIADSFNYVVRRVDAATAIITTIAGNHESGFSGDGGLATNANLALPSGVALDGAGNLFIADMWNSRIRVVNTQGNQIVVEGVTIQPGDIATVAGGGTDGLGDGGPATNASLAFPSGVALDGSGNLFIADWQSERIRWVNAATGTITTVAGNGTAGFSGDGGLATSASLNQPYGVAVDGSGNLLIGDTYNNRIRRVDAATGKISTVAGSGSDGDGGPATSALLVAPSGIVADAAGNLFIADTNNSRIRRVDATTGAISTVAGNGAQAFSGDGGPATSASLGDPSGVAVDGSGNLFIADTNNSRIRRVDTTTGTVTTVAGNGTYGFGGDGGPATNASFYGVYGVAVDGSGNLFIADRWNNRIRRVNASTGNITTVAGNGTAGFSGDGGPATGASLNQAYGVAVDSSGNVFIADYGNNRIRRVDAATQIITTVAGSGTSGFSGDGGSATSASLCAPDSVAVDGSGNLFVADSCNYVVRRVDAVTGIITTAAGNGAYGFTGDGGPATTASLSFPYGVAVDGSSHLFIADTDNNRIREVLLAPAVTLSTTSLSFSAQVVGTISLAQTLTVTNSGGANLTISSVSLSGANAANFTLPVPGNTCPISPATLNPGSTCAISVTFKPSQIGTRIGTLTITDNAAGSPHTVALSGPGVTSLTGPAVSLAPASLTFPAQNLETTSLPQVVTLTNSGVSPLTISSIVTSANYTQTSTCPPPYTLASLVNCFITVTFSPTVAGPEPGTLTITDNSNGVPGSVQTVGLSGTGAFPVPQIEQPLVPAAAVPGGAQFTLTVNGTGFVSGATVNWNGVALATAFVSAEKLTATVPAANIATAGTALVTVVNPGGVPSNIAFFQITNLTPSVSLANAPGSPIAVASPPGGIGSNPMSIAVGDFNGDGKLDLAIANNCASCSPDYPSTLTIVLGNGDGTFITAPGSPITVAFGPEFVGAGDFNGDGNLDLAVANMFGNGLTILLGNGHGTFTPAAGSPIAVGVNPVSFAIGDFNGDGKLDLAVTNASTQSHNLTILLGNGDGTFTPVASPPATGSSPGGITVGDFNGDGNLDLAVTNVSDNTVTILLGDGGGTFTPTASSPLAVGTFPWAVAAGDFNGDGKLDLAVANIQSNNVTILLGNGDGTFTPASGSPVAVGTGPNAVAVGDFNGDGKLDLAVSNYGSNNVTILLGNGNGTFTPASGSPVAVGTGASAVVVGDFNRDGRLDLATANESGNTVSILLQVPVASPSPTSLPFGNQNVGTTSGTQSVTLTNTGSAPMAISSVSLSGANAANFALPGNTCPMLTPPPSCASSAGFYNGFPVGSPPFSSMFYVTAPNINGDRLVVGTPTGGTAAFMLALQLVPVQNVTNQEFCDFVQLAPGVQALAYVPSAAERTGDFSAFTGLLIDPTTGLPVSGGILSPASTFWAWRVPGNAFSPPAGLAPGATCTINVSFSAPTTGAFSAQVTIADNAWGAFQVISLSGTGVTSILGSAVSLAPASLSFPAQTVGTTSSPLIVTLTNTGVSPLTISSIATSSDYTQTNTCPISPTTLAPQANCSVSVTFTPTVAGSDPGALTITDNASNSPQSVPLAATFTTPQQPVSPGTSTTFTNAAIMSETVTLPSDAVMNSTVSKAVSFIPVSPAAFSQTRLPGTTQNPDWSGGITPIPTETTCTVIANTGGNCIVIRDLCYNANGNPITCNITAPTTPIQLTAHYETPSSPSCPGYIIADDNQPNWAIITNAYYPGDTTIGGGTKTLNTDTAVVDLGAVNCVTSITGPAVSLAPASLVFPAQSVGTTSSPLVVTLTNTGVLPLTISNIATSGDYTQTNTCPISPTTLAPQANCSISVTFKPTVAGTDPGTLTITDNAGNSPQSVPLAATFTTSQQSVSPGTSTTFTNATIMSETVTLPPNAAMNGTASKAVSFIPLSPAAFSSTRLPGTKQDPNWSGGITPIPAATTCTVIANTGGNCIVIRDLCYDSNHNPITCNITAPSIPIQLTSQYETPSSPSCPAYVIADDNQPNWAIITNAYYPGDTTIGGGTKTLNTDTAVVDLGAVNCVTSTTGPAVSLAPPSLSFPAPSSPLVVTLTNTGVLPLTISNIATSGDYAQTNTCPLPSATLAPQANCSISVTFTRTVAGTDPGTLTITDNASNSPQSVPLAATFTTPQQPVSPGTSTTFNNATIMSETVLLPPDANMTGAGTEATAFKAVSFIPVPPAVFSWTRLPGTTQNPNWSGGITPIPTETTCTVIANTGGNCIVIRDLCYDSNHNPITCNITAPSIPIQLTSHYETPSSPSCPGYIIADDNQPNWAVITSAYYPSDTTIGGGTKTLNTDTAVVDLGAGNCASAFSGTTPPTTAAVTSPAHPNGANGWFTTSPVTVILASTGDALVKQISYSINGGAPLTVPGASTLLQITNQGVTTISYQATDEVGNVEALKTLAVKIDTTPPVVSVTGVTNGATYTLGAVPTAGCGTIDAISGVATAASLTLTGGVPPGVGSFTATCSGAVDMAGNLQAAPVTATYTVTPGPLASVAPSSIDFGTVYLGTITIKNVTVTNQGDAPMTITDPFLSILSGGNSNEFVAVNLCPRSLAAGKSCTIGVIFIAAPYYTPQTATLSVMDNAPGSPQTVALSATVINPQAHLSATSLSFGTQKVNKSGAAKAVTLTNTGATALTITSIAIAGTYPGDFMQTNNCPSSLAAKASCTISVTFTPQAKGLRSASVVITDNAQNSPQNISLSGTGN